MRLSFTLALFAFACSKPGPGLVDGGGFMLPDGGKRDAGELVPDSGLPDSGPFVCNPACNGEVCACLGPDCGCHPPQPNNERCDPQVPESCTAGLTCARARREGIDLTICSDGSDGTSCSHTQDLCTTALGCVCLTDPTSLTDCSCTETIRTPSLCDPMVAGSCVSRCVRVEGPSGVYFVCSSGAEGSPCEPGNDNCQTSLGCICPLADDVERCQCREPSGAGGLCDIDVPASCISPLMCVVSGSPIEGRSTICSSGMMSFPDAGPLPCDPDNPSTCPPGQTCVEGPNGFMCV